jgi:N-acetylglutamate synthase-like GNAT family acetyltransferase
MNPEQPEEQPAEYQLRRATLEDLPELKKLWGLNHLPFDELEKRFTEFQVAIDGRQKVAGAIGLKVAKNHGLIHSESFVEMDKAEALRPLLWGRIMTVAKNHGLVRLWALPTTSFFRQQGMTEIDDTLRARLPEGFGPPMADWLSLKLKEEIQQAASLEQEFEVFAAAQKESNERMMRQAATLKVFAYVLLLFALMGAAFLIYFAFKHYHPR